VDPFGAGASLIGAALISVDVSARRARPRPAPLTAAYPRF
jgi:hypothetical protein